jgi:tRNA threonylcarbamoyl adenosine modification protein YeaZ
MKAIFLNFASNNSSPDAEAFFACVSEDKTAVYAPIDHRLGDAQLLPALEKVLKKAGWEYQDLTHIAAIIGPGGFTSLRMAVSLANVLADQLGIPVAGIHLSDLYAARLRISVIGHRSSGSLIWMHSTKKTELFIRSFGIADSPWEEPTLLPIEKLKAESSKLEAHQWAGELIPEHRTIIDSFSLPPASLAPISDILPQFLTSQTYEKKLLQPWYGRGW